MSCYELSNRENYILSNQFPVNFQSGPEQAIIDKILCIIVQIVLIYRELELRHAIL